MDNLTKTLAVEWAHSGVRVNAIAPVSLVNRHSLLPLARIDIQFALPPARVDFEIRSVAALAQTLNKFT